MHNYSINEKLQRASRVLVLAVGGGNDSVSSLLLQLQLARHHGYAPASIDIAAMLPDCLDYSGLARTTHPLIGVISAETCRSVQGSPMTAFPERILAQNKKRFSDLPVENVYGLNMSAGSTGILSALRYLLEYKRYDLLLAVDVGGDFIACAENFGVLSPQMDGYAAYALQQIQKDGRTPIVYAVFGLGTDGESTPELLEKSLALVRSSGEAQTCLYDKEVAACFNEFYKSTVEPNRYSRTTDFTLKQILGTFFKNPAEYRARFHVAKPPGGAASTKYYGTFEHYQDPAYFGKYVLFSNIDFVRNVFCQQCDNGIEWFIRVQNCSRLNHELNGQAYLNLGKYYSDLRLANKSLFFGTPSNKFGRDTQIKIARDIVYAVLGGVYDLAVIYEEYASLVPPSLTAVRVGSSGLAVIGVSAETVAAFQEKAVACLSTG